MEKESFERSLKRVSNSGNEVHEALVDNFINLQKVLTNLSLKFEELSKNISKLLELFEISARTLAERYSSKELLSKDLADTELIEKLNLLIEQNKIISKGIMLIEEKIREKGLDNIQQYSRYPYRPIQQPVQQQFPYRKEANGKQNLQ